MSKSKHKFHKGDVVKCVNAWSSMRLKVGKTYTVRKVFTSTDGKNMVGIVGDKHPGDGWYESRFELVTRAPRAPRKPKQQPATSVDPKQGHGATKSPLGLIPGTAEVQEAAALQFGADKYGPFNWREAAPSSYSYMTYLHAMLRHLRALIDREDFARDSGLHHLAHVRAGAGIVLDAIEQGTIKDDRPPKGYTANVLEAFNK